MELKKNEDKRVERKMPLFYLVGLNVALFFTIVAFEWKTIDGGIINLDNLTQETDWVDPPVIIPQPPVPVPPKPKPQIRIAEVVEEPEEVPQDIIIDSEPTDEPIPPIDFEPTPPVPVDEAPFIIVEDMPEFPGGMEAFYKFISKKVKYPAQARRMGIEGRVYLQFVVEKDGSIGDLFVAKGVGAGLDEESLRVMKLVPNFKPGKQRGRPVRVQMTIPINFRLN